MKIIKKAFGKILYGTAKVLSLFYDGLIKFVENMIVYSGNFLKGCLAIAGMGGCLFFILFANLGLRLLANPIGLFIALFILSFLLFGRRFIASLKYHQYTQTGYLFQTAQFLMEEEKYEYQPFRHFQTAYQKMEEEKIREEQRRYAEQQRQWEEKIKQQWYQQYQQQYQGQYQYQGQGGYQGYQQRGYGFGNPDVTFRHQYEKSCDILGVGYQAEAAEIKSAYRRKAKQYHPDLCNLPDATKRFQEVNMAYEFLSEQNRQRYQSL